MKRIDIDDDARSFNELLNPDPERSHEFDEADTRQRPPKVDRNSFDGVQDDYLHPNYDAVLPELPPGEHFVIHDGPQGQYMTNNVWKRSQNRNLQYPFFPSYELLYTKKSETEPAQSIITKCVYSKLCPGCNYTKDNTPGRILAYALQLQLQK